MPKKRKMPKKFHGVDKQALAVIQAESIAARVRRGLPPTKEQIASWSPDLADEMDRRHLMLHYAHREQVLTQAQTDERVAFKVLAMKAGEEIDNRKRGVPQQKDPPRGGVTIIFGDGLNPDLLPSARFPREAKVLPGQSPTGVPPKRPPATASPEPEE